MHQKLTYKLIKPTYEPKTLETNLDGGSAPYAAHPADGADGQGAPTAVLFRNHPTCAAQNAEDNQEDPDADIVAPRGLVCSKEGDNPLVF